MKNHIAEELPERKFHQASAEKEDHKSEKKGDPKNKVRQAVYDIRYRARREELPLQQAYSQYMQNSNMSQEEKSQIKAKLFGNGPIKEDFQIEEFASQSLAKVMYRVFVEKNEENTSIELNYLNELSETEERKYKVRVTGKDNRSYVRYATREKINSLRANPNIESVEMTEYGEPYEGEKKRGEETARAKAGKDYDGDGKVESGAKEHAGAVHNAIQRKKGGIPDGKDTSNVKEEFIDEVKTIKKKKDNKKLDIRTGKDKVDNKIVVAPAEPNLVAHNELEGNLLAEKSKSIAQQKFMGMVYSAKKGEKPASPEVAKAAAGMTKGEAKKFAKTKHKGLPVHKEESECGTDTKKKDKDNKEPDSRSLPAKANLVKNYVRSATGIKNPLVMMSAGYELDGELVDEGTEEAQERRFQKHGDRSEGETHTRLIGRAARASDSLRARMKRIKPESPKGQELERRKARMGERMEKLMKARQKDSSKFRQGPTDKSMERKG